MRFKLHEGSFFRRPEKLPMKRLFLQDHDPVEFLFRQSADDFIVDELPMERDHGSGGYLIVKVQKQNLTTTEMLKLIEAETHCHTIGYAGLKDKAATTTQYLSMPLAFSKALENFKHPQVKILEGFRSRGKIGLGDLEGNRFFIRLKQVTPESAQRLQELLDEIMRQGMPNYFGYQRFGRESGNFEKAREVAQGEIEIRDRRMQRLLSSAYQSYLFNDWLARRIRISKAMQGMDIEALAQHYGLSKPEAQQLLNQPGLFRVLPGDIMLDQKTRKWVNVTDLQAIRKPYRERKLVPTGLLPGKKAWRAKALAGSIEREFDDMTVIASGDRRPAWVYPAGIRWEYIKEEGFFELSFTLPKGAYATVLLENLANRELG
jgi:tRNA pseudouridine13 synthase